MSSSWHIKGQRHFPNNKNHVIATCHRCCFCSRLCSRLQNCSPGKTIVAKFRNKMRKSQNCVFVRCCIHGQTQKSHCFAPCLILQSHRRHSAVNLPWHYPFAEFTAAMPSSFDMVPSFRPDATPSTMLFASGLAVSVNWTICLLAFRSCNA